MASAPTVWRALDELNLMSLKRIERARAVNRAWVWDLIPGGLPASVVAGMTLPGDVVVLVVDAIHAIGAPPTAAHYSGPTQGHEIPGLVAG